jgi:sugar phosphate isomerase/epimerase
VSALDPEWFTVCLDIGHIGLVGDYEKDTILALGAEKLTCVHVHDNDYLHDLHIAPFTGKLPWNDICSAFAQIGYNGDLTLEADQFLSKIPRALYPSALRFMHDAGRELIRMIVK